MNSAPRQRNVLERMMSGGLTEMVPGHRPNLACPAPLPEGPGTGSLVGDTRGAG